ncbi:hypothetical protein A3B18_01070 [Candidatus Giovannonibacteria bacterium RIFCSPLOWO2_01_FULL_46_13]|uniref:Uncharacterized protein n=1 Tax=Candidatus Giovannonibacteria bacterium RIFCSPLOWO2_01_FULL_46_13 TaxID=1798352 RepID=A0A1F5X3N7_9BACT|nr:MAG: hypothetical protein A3B18_01070 [Candidatus Giovannonibacteria bacterium RIFCSPLOWO2_01_FULL_46_13]
MARILDREKALLLRKRGESYSQIKKQLGISKSTLSYWLRDYPLSKERVSELRDWNEHRIENFRATLKKKRENRLRETYVEQQKSIFPLTQRELFLSGLFLYWGEGTKTAEARLAIANTDPSMIKFFIFWLKRIFGVPKKKLKVYLHLYKDMNINKEIKYWSATTNIPILQFRRPYIKETKFSGINYKRGFGHGTCNIIIGDARLSEKVLMGIKALSNHYLGV